MQNNEFKASKVDAAIDQGLKELGIEKENAEIEVISKGGLFKKAVVKVEKKKAPESPGKQFIQDIMKFMNLSCVVEEKERDSQISFFIKGNDASRIIGHRGETLDALQYLVSNKVNSEKKYKRVIVDADFYRQKRERTLTNLARRLARKASTSGQEIELEPMNSFERRIIHSALSENNFAKTRSEGQGRDRHIVISPIDEGKEVEYGSTNFNKVGPKKTKKFGYKKKR